MEETAEGGQSFCSCFQARGRCTTDLWFSPPSGGSVYSVAKAPLGDFSPLPSSSRSWQGVLETDAFSGKGKSSSDKTDLQQVTGQVPRISSAPPGSHTCLFLPQAGGQGEWTHLPREDRPQTVGAVRSSSQNMSPALKGGKEGWALRCGSRCQLWESGASKSSRACTQACRPVLRHSAPEAP